MQEGWKEEVEGKESGDGVWGMMAEFGPYSAGENKGVKKEWELDEWQVWMK